MYNPFNRPNLELPPEFPIHVENLSVVADETTLALSGISLTIEPGEYVGIIGQNSSGKTTYANMILGLGGQKLAITEGSVKYDELDIYASPMNKDHRTKLRRQHFGYVPKVHELNPDLSGAQNIRRTYHLQGRKVTDEMLGDVADRFEITDKLHLPVKALSSGMRQRVNVARGLVMNPKIAILDEPTEALDPEHKEKLVHNLQDYAHKFGNTVIIISHEQTGADRLVEFSSGKVLSDTKNNRGVAA